MNTSGAGEMGVGEKGVGEMRQIIGETGVSEMGIGETGTSRSNSTKIRLQNTEQLQPQQKYRLGTISNIKLIGGGGL